MSLQRARGKGAPYRGGASNPKLVLLLQLLAEDESRPVKFKIKGHVANTTLPTASWDAFAGGALLGSLHCTVQVVCLPTHNPSFNLLETHSCWAHLTEVFSPTTRWSHCTEGSHQSSQADKLQGPFKLWGFLGDKKSTLEWVPPRMFKIHQAYCKAGGLFLPNRFGKQTTYSILNILSVETLNSGIDRYKGGRIRAVESGCPHLGQ